MLQRLGCRDLEQLLQECVPAEILIDADQARDALPQECDERQALRELEQRAAANTVLRNLIGHINYGGRVTDDWDRRLMNVYMASFFNEDVLNVPGYRLSALPNYVVPEDGPLSLYREVCAGLPQVDRPECYGQHANADVASDPHSLGATDPSTDSAASIASES